MKAEDQLAQIVADMSALKGRFEEHVEREEAMWMEAFPGGDVSGHRKAHEAMIVAAQEQAKFWAELRLDLAKKSIWVLLAVLFTLVAAGGWAYVLQKLASSGAHSSLAVPIPIGKP